MTSSLLICWVATGSRRLKTNKDEAGNGDVRRLADCHSTQSDVLLVGNTQPKTRLHVPRNTDLPGVLAGTPAKFPLGIARCDMLGLDQPSSDGLALTSETNATPGWRHLLWDVVRHKPEAGASETLFRGYAWAASWQTWQITWCRQVPFLHSPPPFCSGYI